MIVCFDIGGTTIKGAIAYAPDDIRPVPRIPTPKTSFEDFAAGLKSVIDNSGGTPACVSLSIAGVIDPDTGKATVANIQSIHGRVLKDELEKALNLPVIVSNDADCFVIAESEIGSGRGHRVVFGVILGTGVGGSSTATAVSPANGDMGRWPRHWPEIHRFRCRVSNAVAGLPAASTQSAAPVAWKNCIRIFTGRR
jgi:N-acetylglucosamine kinase